MALVKTKPTLPGRRSMMKVVNPDLHKGAPHVPLLRKQIQKSGRNNNGHITTCHRGGGHKHHYHIVGFKRNDKDGTPAKIERLEYDPSRSTNIALVLFVDGERRYIIAPKGAMVSRAIANGLEALIKAGNNLPIRNIPVGTTIHCVEALPDKGAQVARLAGTSAMLLAREGIYAQVRLRSGEVCRMHIECRAIIGEIGNEEHNLRQIGKAGATRWCGTRPTVRGVVMNPVDHPHGGGEGKIAAGRDSVFPRGTPAKGYRTRRNKRTDSMTVRRRHKR